MGRVFDDVLEQHQIVGRVQQIRKSEIDLALSGGRDLVVMTFDLDADLAEDRRDRIAKIDQRVERGDRDITFFRADVITVIYECRPHGPNSNALLPN